MQKVAREAITENKVLGLPYHIVRGDYLFLIHPDGSLEKVKKLRFARRKLDISNLNDKIGTYKIRLVKELYNI